MIEIPNISNFENWSKRNKQIIKNENLLDPIHRSVNEIPEGKSPGCLKVIKKSKKKSGTYKVLNNLFVGILVVLLLLFLFSLFTYNNNTKHARAMTSRRRRTRKYVSDRWKKSHVR